MSETPSLSEIETAARALAKVLPRTPCVRSKTTGIEWKPISLKLETFQPVGSFKIRGILHCVAAMTDAERQRGLLTVSAGNTAQALAWAGRHFGVRAESVMPETAPSNKIEAVHRLGGTTRLMPMHEVFRFMKEELWTDEPSAFVHPWTDTDVACGHGSLGLEILTDVPDVDSVYVPVGGGGLLAGVGAALKASRPEVRVVAVEPEGCPSFTRSLAAGHPVEVDCNTICDGVAVPYTTEQMFPILRELCDETMLVSEVNVRSAVRRLALEDKVVAEPAGALALAAALEDAPERRGHAVCIVTGGSIDGGQLADILRGVS